VPRAQEFGVGRVEGLEGEIPMKFRRTVMLTAGVLLVAGAARAETQEQCVRGDCEYRFDDGDVNSPGWSPYLEYIKVGPRAKRVTLIRPRISFVMELVKSTQGVW
jgi:hypothetical protein